MSDQHRGVLMKHNVVTINMTTLINIGYAD